MPRYYFDVHNGENILRDDDGTEFDSLDAAVRGGDTLGGGDWNEPAGERQYQRCGHRVRDERGQRVCTVTASMKIDWHAPRP